MLGQQAALRQFVEIFGRGRARYGQFGLHVIDPCIRVAEQVVEQVLRIDSGVVGAQALLEIGHQAVDRLDQAQRLLRGLGNAAQHVEQPRFPVAGIAHRLQQPVIVRLAAGDEAAEIQDRNVEQPGPRQVQHVDDPPEPTVAVGEGVDAFELVMDDRHLDQRVEIAVPAPPDPVLPNGIVVDEDLQRVHVCDDRVGVLRRDIDHRAGLVVLEGGARRRAKPAVGALEHLEHGNDHRVGQQTAQAVLFAEAMAQRVGIERDFLCRRGRRVFGKGARVEQLVLRGDDVLDLGARLGFLHRKHVDQDALIGDRCGTALQLGEVPVRLRERAEHRGRFLQPRRGQIGNDIAGRQHGAGVLINILPKSLHMGRDV